MCPTVSIIHHLDSSINLYLSQLINRYTVTSIHNTSYFLDRQKTYEFSVHLLYLQQLKMFFSVIPRVTFTFSLSVVNRLTSLPLLVFKYPYHSRFSTLQVRRPDSYDRVPVYLVHSLSSRQSQSDLLTVQVPKVTWAHKYTSPLLRLDPIVPFYYFLLGSLRSLFNTFRKLGNDFEIQYKSRDSWYSLKFVQILQERLSRGKNFLHPITLVLIPRLSC